MARSPLPWFDGWFGQAVSTQVQNGALHDFFVSASVSDIFITPCLVALFKLIFPEFTILRNIV